MVRGEVGIGGVEPERGLGAWISSRFKAYSILVAAVVLAAGVVLTPQLSATEVGMAGMPFVAISHPQFLHASQATFLQPDDLLIGIVDGNVAKAYPAAMLAQHGVVQDEMPNGPIAVTWCSNCNTGLVFSTVVRGRTLTFVPDGLIGSNEVFKDTETGSRWQQSTFTAFSGPLKGARLKIYPFLLTTWAEWHKLHPSTLVLKPLPGYKEQLPSVNKFLHNAELGFEGPAPWGAFGHDTRLQPMITVAGLETGGAMKAYPMLVLRRTRVINDTVGTTPVLIVHQPVSDTTTAFVAEVEGRRLTFRAANAQASRLVDLETHSAWTAYGDCVAGPMKGIRLKSLTLEAEFWFAWSEFHPHTLLYEPAGIR